MKRKLIYFQIAAMLAGLLVVTACQKKLDTLEENKTYTGGIDYTKTSDMIKPLIGIYVKLSATEWENYPLIAVRGDDVNAGGLGDQQDLAETDKFKYNKDYWMYNSVWQNHYIKITNANSAIEQIQKYKEFASDKALADQYIAEVRVLRAYWLLQLSRIWGAVPIPIDPDPTTLYVAPLSTKDEVMQHISDQIDLALPFLVDMRPNQRTDIPGAVTKYTGLAVKAMANLELKNYQKVADATGEIIKSGKFTLETDFYNLFKLKGKLNNENLLEMQYSDLGTGTGDNYGYLYAFFGPQGWTPKVSGAGDGWGFFEPSVKYIKFMLGRGEVTRLQTSVLFTNRGIDEIKKDPAFATLPTWVTNTTPSGDRINNYDRAMFASGKHYLPSELLTPGRTDYGTNQNMICIRYAEILLMYAEALTQNATGSAGSADDAVNAVRTRAGLGTLSGVTNAQVMDEKFAELAMEWGIRYNDMVRLGRTEDLSYEGRTFTADKTFLPYPQAQVDLLPILEQK
jgi:hypothetical protein